MASASASASSVGSGIRAGAGGTPSPSPTATTTAPASQPVVKGRLNILGIILSVLGGIGVISAVTAQAFSIDHGSNQKPIDANNITTVWSIIIGVCLLIVGVILWFHFQSVGGEYRYMYVYGLAFSSYIVATIALYMSTIQVIVRESTS
jgi:hypothetical protein